MAVSSVDDQKISDDGPTMKQVFEVLATWCGLADEAKPLFEALLMRLRVARDEVQRFYDTSHDQADRNRVLKALKDELVTFSIELQRYFGVRQLTATPEPGVRWTEKMFASRVLQHIKLHRKLYEMHGGVHSSDNGLDRLFLLLKVDEKDQNEWRQPFNTAVEEFKKAVADSVENTDMVDVYKRDALLALEAVMLLRNAETFSDPYEWTHNEPAKSLRDKLKTFKDLDALLLPDWFLPENGISYKKRSKNGSFGAIHFGTWASGTNVVVKCVGYQEDEMPNDVLRRMFTKEADLWFKVSHPYILKLYGACHVTAPPFFVCEATQHGDLAEYLKKDKSRLWRLLFQSALAIQYLHSKKIIHGNLKLGNILVGADGFARVANFGDVSRFEMPGRNLTVIDLGPILGRSGALRWCAPEALEDMIQIESDVYSFAMCLIEVIGGIIPYHDVGDDDEVRRRIRAGELPERPKDMDDSIWGLVKKMTASDPTARPSMTDIIPELMKRADDELERKLDRTICPDCSLKLENGVTICPRCKRKIFEVGTIKLNEDDGDYALIHQEDGILSVDEQQISDEMNDDDWEMTHVDPNAEMTPKGAIPMVLQWPTEESANEVDRSVFPDRHATLERMRELRQASREGNVAKVRALLLKGRADVSKFDVDWYGWSSLHEASFHGHFDVVQKLLEANVDPNAATQGGRTPLHWASFQDHFRVVELLLKAKADPNVAAKDGLAPLHEASFQGCSRIVEVLLEANADPNPATARDGYTPLHYASLQGCAPVVEGLLKTNADPNATDKNGWTPLHWASSEGHVSVVELLLKANANSNTSDKNGRTPLHAACGKHKCGVVCALIAGGSDPHAQDERGREPLHACIESNAFVKLSNETLPTIQILVSYGATWDATCDDMVLSGRARDEAPALRLCILLWTQEHADGLEISDIPIEVIERGTDSTQTFINALKTSLKIVLRRKICVVGSSFAGKTSFVKSITSESLMPQLEHVDDRTIGIDHFPLRFEQSIISRDGTKIHEVTFWDFAGQNAYQVAHSLFFSPRTLFLVVVDLHAFAIAYMQAVIFANKEYQVADLLGEFVEDAISHWIRLILARQPDAEFVFIATKDDVLKENTVTEMLLKDELMKKLRGVGVIVDQMKKAAKLNTREDVEQKFSSIAYPTTVSVAGQEPRILYVSSTSSASIRAARKLVEQLIIKSERSVAMPDAYTEALDAIVKIREKVKALDISDRMDRVVVPVDALPAKLKIEPGLCHSILQTLHDLGDVLWYEDVDVDFFQKSVILDPMLLIDFIRQVITHKHTGQTLSHTDLKAKPFWRGLEKNNTLMEAMKKLMQHFHLVYSEAEDRVMRWDSHLIVPAFWQTKPPASWKFLGAFLCLKALKNVVDGERVRVRWEYHFAFGLPVALFDNVVVATLSSFFCFDAGPDWILYEGSDELTACRLMVSRDLRSLRQTVEVEAVVAKAASKSQVTEFWDIFEHLVGGFVGILKECPGLVVSAYNKDGQEKNLKHLLQSKSSLAALSASWMPPLKTWETFRLTNPSPK